MKGGAAFTLNVSPCPEGVNGTDIGHYLYLTGLPGAAESVLITGGTCTSGRPVGTIVFTPANNHLGQWTLQSASGGLQETLQSISAGSVGAKVLITVNTYLHARVTIPLNGLKPAFTIEGQGHDGAPAIIRATDYPAGDLIYLDESLGGSGSLTVRNIWIFNSGPYGSPVNTGGAAIHIKGNTMGTILIENNAIDNGYRGIEIESSWFVTVRNNLILNSAGFAAVLPSDTGIYLHDTGGVRSCVAVIKDNGILGGAPISANATEYGIRVDAADGVEIAGNGIAQIKTGILLNAWSGKNIGAVQIHDNVLDTFQVRAIYLWGGAGAGNIGNVSIRNNHISTRADIYPAVASLSNIEIASLTPVAQIAIQDNVIFSSQQTGLYIGGATADLKHLLVDGNIFADNNRSNTASQSCIAIASVISTNFDIKNNLCYNTAAGHQKYGLYAGAGLTAAKWNVSNNSFNDMETAPVLLSTIPAGLVAGFNLGIDNVIPPVASGATITAPMNPIIEVTGVITITTMNGGWTGCEKTLIFTNAAPGGVGGGGNIPRVQAAAQNQAIVLRYNGANWY